MYKYKQKLKCSTNATVREELQQMETHHMRMIYDSYCEALNTLRPYGRTGKSLPWKLNSMKLTKQEVNLKNSEKTLQMAIAKILKWGSFLCGFIPERIFRPGG